MKRGRFVFILLILLAAPVAVGAKIVINEVAWMGTAESASNEWIELFSDAEQNLDGWILTTEDGGTNLKLKGTVVAGGFYLIERTDDNSVPDIKADLILPFGKGLSNSGEILILKDSSGIEIDRVDGSNGWPIGGDSDTKQTLQRAKNESLRWITAKGTPKAENAVFVKKVVKPKTLPASTPGEKPDFPGESDFGEDGTENKFAASAFDAESPSSNSEYLWLLGGILGGAVIGLVCVIIIKWRKSP